MGKFLQVDPKADKYGSLTTYNYAGNNPVVFNDPMGDDYTITINWDEVEGDGYHWENPDKEEQDYQPGVSDFGWMQDATARADAMFDAMNGVYNPLWHQMQYGTPAPRIGAGFSLLSAMYVPSIARQNVYFTTPLGDRVRAQDVLDVDPTHQNPKWRAMAMLAFVKAQQENPIRVWYTYTHLDYMDIVRQHTVTRTSKEEVTTVKVVIIKYTDGLFGKDHEIISYGFKTEKYLLDNIEFDRKILAEPIYDFFYGEFKIDDPFYNKIYGMVNEHLDCDCYMYTEPKFQIGAPHR